MHSLPEHDPATGEAAYRALLQAVLDPTVAIDALGVVVAASDSVRDFGWAPADLVGRNISILMPEPHRSAHDGYLEHYRRTGETGILGRTREFQVVCKDGRILDVELSVARADVPGRELPLFIGSFRDVSERLRTVESLAEHRERLRVLFDESNSSVALLDLEGHLLEVNRAALASTGTTLKEVIGKPFWETRWWRTSEEDRESLRRALRRTALGERVRYETTNRGRGREILHVDFSLSPVRDADDEVRWLIATGHDITDLVRAQRAETSMLRALAEIGESAAMLAHEIKNPITAVNTALRAVAKALGEDQAAVLEDLASRMQRLERVMRRTLSYTRPVEIRRSSFLLRSVVDAVVRDRRMEILKLGAEVDPGEVPEDLELTADRQLLEEVLLNLIANALEAAEDAPKTSSRPHVRIAATLIHDGDVRIVVEDNGPGISENVRLTLFKPFATTKVRGTGLGLPFCRKVLEAHDGTIEVDSGALGGARFTLTLPAPEL